MKGSAFKLNSVATKSALKQNESDDRKFAEYDDDEKTINYMENARVVPYGYDPLEGLGDADGPRKRIEPDYQKELNQYYLDTGIEPGEGDAKADELQRKMEEQYNTYGTNDVFEDTKPKKKKK